MLILCRFVSGFKKNVIYFYVRQLEMPKIAFQKCDVITFTWFSGHCTAKNKDIALKFCVRVFCKYPEHVYSCVLDNLEISDLTGNHLKK